MVSPQLVPNVNYSKYCIPTRSAQVTTCVTTSRFWKPFLLRKTSFGHSSRFFSNWNDLWLKHCTLKHSELDRQNGQICHLGLYSEISSEYAHSKGNRDPVFARILRVKALFECYTRFARRWTTEGSERGTSVSERKVTSVSELRANVVS